MRLFQVSELMRHLDLQYFVLEWQEHFISHVSLHLVKWDLSRLNQQILRQMLVDVPDVARLEQLQMVIERDLVPSWNVMKHVILIEQVADERIPDIVVFLELRDQPRVLLPLHDLDDALRRF